MIHLTLLTRGGCRLCDEMKGVVQQVEQTQRLTLTEIDISTRPELETQWGTAISRPPMRRTGDRQTPRDNRSVGGCYFEVTVNCPRRFCAQQLSVESRQDGDSSPLLTVAIRSPAMPRPTR